MNSNSSFDFSKASSDFSKAFLAIPNISSQANVSYSMFSRSFVKPELRSDIIKAYSRNDPAPLASDLLFLYSSHSPHTKSPNLNDLSFFLKTFDPHHFGHIYTLNDLSPSQQKKLSSVATAFFLIHPRFELKSIFSSYIIRCV